MRYQNNPGIYCFWHNRLALMPFMRPRKLQVNVLSSDHRDGRTVAQVMRIFNFKTIFGSSNKNSFFALKSILLCLKSGQSIAITPDGPKGPVHQINGNIIPVAALSGAGIIPMSYACKRAKIFNSWDKFVLPLPFNRLILIYGKPIMVNHKPDEQTLTQLNLLLQQELNSITQEAENLLKSC